MIAVIVVVTTESHLLAATATMIVRVLAMAAVTLATAENHAKMTVNAAPNAVKV